MNDHDDLERIVIRSLRQQTERASASVPDLEGVWIHLDRRRSRRRHVAVGGSVAIVAVGALGLASVSRGDPDRIPAPAAAVTPDAQAAWRCTDQLDHFEEGSPAVFFVNCESVTVDGSARIFDVPTPTTPGDGTFVGVPATAVPMETVQTTAPVQETRYTIQTGDTIESIAAAFDTSPEAIADLNQWNDLLPERIQAGDTILVALIPFDAVPTTVERTGSEQPYVIQEGDSLGGIASTFDITLEQLVNYNQFEDGPSQLILVGDLILIPPDALLVAATTTTSVLP